MSANTRTDGVCDLGYSNSQFKDLYLSGEAKASKVVIDDSDGGDIVIKKGGTSSVYIGEQAGGLGSGDGLLLYGYNSGTIKIWPQAQSVAEFTDAGLVMSSGKGIYLGGTGAANKLDDYETGIWTPTLGGTWTSNPYSLSGQYVKIGKLVHVKMIMSDGTKASSTSAWIAGLPFTNSGGEGTGSVSNSSVDDYGNCLLANTDRIWLTETSFNGTIYITACYETTA
jgi:hypothetical protein